MKLRHRSQYEPRSAQLEKIAYLEEQLKVSEGKFRAVFTTSPDSMNLSRLSDGMFVYVNEGFTRITGYEWSEIEGKTSLEINLWADPADRNKVVEILRDKGKVENFEARFLRKDGTTFFALMSASVIDYNGVPHILNIAKDISERKHNEDELIRDRFLIDSLMENLPDHIYFKDRESRFIRINKSHVEKFGFADPSIAVGKTDFDFFTEEHARQAFEDEQEIIRSGRPVAKEEKETHKDKPDTWVSTVKMPWRDTNGNIIGTFGISRDITAKKRIELENEIIFEISRGLVTASNLDDFLKLVHRSLSRIVYSENIFIALYDEAGKLFSFPYFVDKYDEVPPPLAMEKSCTAFVFRSGRPLFMTEDVFQSLLEQNEVELVGSPSPSWVGLPLKTPSKVIGVLVLQHYENENVYSVKDVDFLITVSSQIALAIERWRSEEEIRTMNDQLRLSNSEKDKFFSIIAHDLKGPLSAFVQATQVILENQDSLGKEEIVGLTESMKSDASSVYKLLENLLEWSRLKRGVIEFNPVRINILSWVRAILDLTSDTASRKNITLSSTVSPEDEICADQNMLDSILRNLVSNAIKFTPEGGRVTVSASSIRSQEVIIRVSDSGIGMDSELKSKLFKLNEKVSRLGTNGESSSGLGLLLCKEFVEKHKGKITVESKPGEGSTFIFTIPYNLS